MSSTFLGLCKCIPQVRQVVYQAGCAVLKLRVSDTGMQRGGGWGGGGGEGGGGELEVGATFIPTQPPELMRFKFLNL